MNSSQYKSAPITRRAFLKGSWALVLGGLTINNLTMDSTSLPPSSDDLYTRLDNNKPENTEFITDKSWFSLMTQNLLEKQEKGDKISFWVGGGGAYGLVTYRLIKNLLDNGIKPDEYVWNSVWAIISTLLSQGYTDEKYIDFFFGKLTNMKDLTPAYFLSHLIPFTVDLSEENRNFLIEQNEKFESKIKSEKIGTNQSASAQDIKSLVSNFLKENGKEITDAEWEKISFNDIKKEHQNELAIQASVLSLKPNWMKEYNKKPIAPQATPSWRYALGGRWVAQAYISDQEEYKQELWVYNQKLEEWEEMEKTKWNKNHNRNIRPITFRGSYPILDALIASASPNFIKNTTVKGKEFKTTDGYWSGQNYPHKESDFSLPAEPKDTTKVVFMTEDNFWMTKKLSPDFQQGIDYVVRPDMRAGGAFDFTWKARERFEKIAMKIIETP